MRYSDYVNVLMGTTGSGKAVAGPQMPHGMVKLAPDTYSLNNGGYDYNDDVILGFSHTRIEGIGGTGGRGHVMVMPANGEMIVEETEFCSKFTHKREIAEVGYYSVDLLKYEIRTEMSATKNCSIFRFTYPKSSDSRILIDLSHTLHTLALGYDGHAAATAPDEIRGYGVYPVGHPGSAEVRVFFVLRLSKRFDRVLYWQNGHLLENADETSGKKIGAIPVFATEEGEVVTAKIGISYISEEQAALNLDRQIPDFDFDRVVESCKTAWDKSLSVIDVDTDDDTAKRIFYSDLYRCMNLPVEYDEEDGKYFLGADGTRHVRDSNGRHFYSDIWAIWDTFRATHPLQQLIEPERQDDVSQSLLENYYVSGKLPMSPAPCLGLMPCMTGHHAASVMTESYAKGRRNFDVETAYAAMKYATTRTDIGAEGIPAEYAELGYLPAEEDHPEHDFSVSKTMELTYDDWCTAELARALGHEEDYKFLSERAKNYRNVFDPKRGFVRRKRADGTWVEPFNPNDSHKRGFCECTPWEYTTLVPHDIQGIINLMGGDERMVEHIDGTFSNNRFNHINETAFHIPFIYTFAHAPYKTMEVCRNFMTTVHDLTPGGVYGEDDSGSMSAWFAFIAMGLFPSCPARPCYTLTSPAFRRWTLHLPGGKTFTVSAPNNSKKNIYIQSALLNGQPYNKCWLAHADIMAGGELVLDMGDTPSDWGTAFESAPPSLTTETPKFTVLDVFGSHTAQAGKESKVTVRLKNTGADGSLDCKIFENGLLRSREVCYLDSGAEGEFELTYTAWDEKTREILVCGTAFPLTITDPVCGTFVYGDTKSDKVMIRHGQLREKFNVSVSVKNESSHCRTETVTCTLDGRPAGSRQVTLAAGEETTVSFAVQPMQIGNHYAVIGSGCPAELDIAGRPDESKWICWRGTKAEFGAAGDNLYIRAAGNQHQYPNVRSNRMEYGILWSRFPVEGDFDAMVRIEYEGYTTPYAQHGIVVKNTLETVWDDPDGLLYAGAMSSRGFFNKVYADKVDPDSIRGMVDGPETPYWIKVEKRGDHFDCYYSMDEAATWTRQGGYTMSKAARNQYVGLMVNSCVPDLRLVKFTDFTVTMVRV